MRRRASCVPVKVSLLPLSLTVAGRVAKVDEQPRARLPAQPRGVLHGGGPGDNTRNQATAPASSGQPS